MVQGKDLVVKIQENVNFSAPQEGTECRLTQRGQNVVLVAPQREWKVVLVAP